MRRPPQRCPKRAHIERLEPRQLLAAAGILHDHDEPLIDVFMPPRNSLWSAGEYLSAPSNADPLAIAINHLQSQARTLGLESSDVANSIVTDRYTDTHSGTTHVYLRQRAGNGLEIISANANVSVARNGQILSLSSGFIGGLSAKLETHAIAPQMTATQALAAAGTELGINLIDATLSGRTAGRDRHSTLRNTSLSLDDIPAKLHYVAGPDGNAELSWNMVLRLPGGKHWYNLSIGDSSRRLTFISDWMDALGSYNVFALPTEAPNDGPRTIVTSPADTLASPFGWHDTNGIAGHESTETVGNNVDAREDIDGNDMGGDRADGGPTLNFDFPLDLTQPPSAYIPASITNLFYVNNVVHDVTYKYGFTESAGNFQTNNYGRGGTGNDAVQADGQDGEAMNNANFGTPPDGQQPRMQMFVWTTGEPAIDSDFDNTVIVHEYGHGISNRLTGGPANVDALEALQSAGMGEGWSDFLALMFIQKTSDLQNQGYPIGTYVLNQPATGSGIRRVPYSYDMTIDPLTWDAYGTSGTTSYGIQRTTQVHRTGEIWCSALWDLNWLLINKYGYDANLYTGYSTTPGPGRAGNKLAMQLVLDGLKFQPANPSFIDARNAILQADQALTGGENFVQIWQAFARRGLGFNASTPSASSSTVNIDFTVPIADPAVVSHAPAGTSLLPATFMEFTFNQAMDHSSFSVLEDVHAFTGPGGTNLKSTITSHSWPTERRLRVNFSSANVLGPYAMVIGPNILSATSGRPMDADGDGIAGEIPDDRYTANFVYSTTLGPEGFGYTAAKNPLQNIDLVAGQNGALQLINGVDDTAAPITLPSGTTFNYYGTNHSTVFASPNGLITFGTSTNSFSNSDLTNTPTQPAIAVLWDDWRTDLNAPGTDSAVLYRLEPNRLIVEWSDVVNRIAGDGTATFQAILQLNTSEQPGRIVLNYPDITTNNAGQSDGASASVGIKNAGPQSANNSAAHRILVSQNVGNHPWVQSNSAILFSPDAQGPTVTAAAFEYLTAHAVRITFSENVGTSISADDLVLHNTTTGATIDFASQAVSYDQATHTATFTFPGLTGQLLSDGNYNATLVSDGIRDESGNSLDGDDDGTIGGDHVFTFFFMRGDANHDRRVNLADFNILAANFGQSPRDFSQGDFTYDGQVNLADFNVLASRFGTALGAALSSRFSPGSPDARQSLRELLDELT